MDKNKVKIFKGLTLVLAVMPLITVEKSMQPVKIIKSAPTKHTSQYKPILNLKIFAISNPRK